ncbi:hypothetical protein os4_22170 [Comamonadaceae bacterium OS-4]|nr:hypothetical protein os4_22170 [Comamonadaceae bacterium OS-4]
MSAKPINVLFLCTHNSARSILTGSNPRENQRPNPIGLQTLLKPATAHWGYADPSADDGSDEQKAEAFKHTLHDIRRRLDLLVNLPADKLEAMTLQQTAKDLATA